VTNRCGIGRRGSSGQRADAEGVREQRASFNDETSARSCANRAAAKLSGHQQDVGKTTLNLAWLGAVLDLAADEAVRVLIAGSGSRMLYTSFPPTKN
jgi:hypothetical protein